MPNVVGVFFPSSTSHFICLVLLASLTEARNIVAFQPPVIFANGPTVTGLLTGNTAGVSLTVRKASVSNTTGRIEAASCKVEAEPTQWVLLKEQVGKTALRVELRLNKSLHLCGDNDTDADCCPKPLCVLETLQVSACVGSTPQAALLIQATIYAHLVSSNAGSDNKTVIPNQVYQPLGPCPCDLTFRRCNIRCCCDKDCSTDELKLFERNCLPGPFGGHFTPPPDYQCSVQRPENSPDWFPFLCVMSPPENNPYLGLFYQGDKISPKPGPTFQMPKLSAPVPVNIYTQGSPIFTWNDQFFTVPQMALGRCVNNAPLAFLENVMVKCVTVVRSCPTGSPLRTRPMDLSVHVKTGLGGEVAVDVTDEVADDMSQFIGAPVSSDVDRQVCTNVTLALDYKFYWKGNGITNITLKRTVGAVALKDSVALTTRYSAVFLNGDVMGEPNSGNPGYQVGRPVIAGIVATLENHTDSVQRTSVHLWKPVSDGLCSTAERTPVVFGENSTSGCLLAISQQNLTQCEHLREAVTSLQAALVRATYVAKSGNPDSLNIADWVNISFIEMNSSTRMEDVNSSCTGVPSHLHIQVWSLFTAVVQGKPQRNIQAMQVSYHLSDWTLDCGGGEVSQCEDPTETQLFPLTSSVTFTDIPIDTGPPKTRFQINYTEYDCNRNDVCWDELAFPVTKYYTGEPFSLSLAKGLILVFFFISASVLGTPWRQIRQAWNSFSK